VGWTRWVQPVLERRALSPHIRITEIDKMIPARAGVLLAAAHLLAGAHGLTYDRMTTAANNTANSTEESTMVAQLLQQVQQLRKQLVTGVKKTPTANESCVNVTIPHLQMAFGMDCTGSTGAYLEALKTTVYELAVELNSSVDTLEMAFLCYRDLGDVSPPRYEWAVHPDPGKYWFSDPVVLQNTIAPFYSAGGGDSPEDNAGAMGQMLTQNPWDPSAVKIVMTISKDKDSKRTPYSTDASQCTLMQDFRAANITLMLGHLDTSTTSSMLWDSTYKPTDPWRGCYADPSDPHQLKEIQFMGVTAEEFSAILIEEICDTITTTPSPTPSAVGDPHLVNIHGERFDILRSGRYKLLQVPFEADKKSVLLAASADVSRIGGRCEDMYFTAINITGQWSREHRKTMFIAGTAPPQTSTGWVHYGPVSLKLVHGRTSAGMPYLNFFVRHMAKVGYRVGGLLGEGDHTRASTPASECQRHMQLVLKTESLVAATPHF